MIEKINSDLLELFKTAKIASENAYSPYSGYKVGAAIKTVNGKIFTGSNIENASYGATICAERTAIFKAVSENELAFQSIAIYVQSSKIFPPCGICRQVIAEFCHDLIIIFGNDTEIKKSSLKELLPESFTKS